jgi:hypothetical protein
MGLIHLHDTAPIPRLPAELERFQNIIDLMLAKDPAMRLSSMDELLACTEIAPA